MSFTRCYSKHRRIRLVLEDCYVAQPCSCGGDGGLTRVAYLNMSDPNQQCPSNWTLTTSPVRGCGRSSFGQTLVTSGPWSHILINMWQSPCLSDKSGSRIWSSTGHWKKHYKDFFVYWVCLCIWSISDPWTSCSTG